MASPRDPPPARASSGGAADTRTHVMTTITPPRSPSAGSRDHRARMPASSRPGTPKIDPFRVLRRYSLAIIVMGLIGCGVGVGAYIASKLFYPLYTGQVLFEIRPGLQDVRQIASGNELVQDQLVLRLAMTESMLLTSRDVLETALRDQQVRQTNWFEQYFVREGVEHVDDAVDELEEDLHSTVVRNTNIFALRWSTHNSTDIPTVLNAVSRAYMDKRKSLDDSTYSTNISVFRDELAKTRREMDDMDQKIRSFILSNGLGTLQDPGDSQVAIRMGMLSEQMTQVNATLSMARSAYKQTAQKLEGRIEPSSDDIRNAEGEPSVANAISQAQMLKTELRRLYEIYKPEHPKVRELELRLRSTELEQDAKIEEVVKRNLEAQLKMMSDQIGQAGDAYDRMSEEYEAKDQQLRELASAQSQYESMVTQRDYLAANRDADLQLIKEVQLMQLRADASRIRLAQPALEPRELSFPKPEIIIPLGALLVTSLTVGLIFLREFTDQRVKSASDLAMLPGARVVGMIPEMSEDPTGVKAAELVVRRQPQSILAESYRQAFTEVTKAIERAGHQSLLLLAGLPGSGTTTVATNLAATSAAAGRRVILIDSNFRRPRLAEAMGVTDEGPGLGDVLSGAVTLGEAVADAGDRIDVIPAGSPANRVVELLTTRQFDSLLAELRDRYDLIILDSPPAVVAGEALVLANKVDAALLVVRANQEHRGLVARLMGQLGDAHCDLLGILLNRPRGTAGGYFKKNFATMAAYSDTGKRSRR